MWRILRSTLHELVDSKKFVVMAASSVVIGAGKLGLHLSVADVVPWVTLAASYIVGQGIADHGKGAREAEGYAAAAQQLERAADNLERRLGELAPQIAKLP